ncbi:Alpha/Beta hydrolase protein [Aspergillus pseudodeflectus]|uniref:Alpha/Beta hydrolase protein n=1 Tax=Aspergillus pseudodeflectus TaxID=176178 RepID=A0ABR4KUB5_9EURO
MSFTRVTFPSNDIEVVGHLYAPAQGAPNRNGAAVVIGHPYTGVKEQVATFYAKYLANEGFYALAFDAAFQGESAGEPRGLENPFQRAEDFKNAVSYLTTLSGKVDPERIGAIGLCGSGGYVCYAAQSDVRIKAVVPFVPFCVGYAVRHNGPNETDPFTREAIAGALKFSADTRTTMATGNFMREGTTYYKTKRSFHERSTGKVHPKSFDMMVNYDSFAFNNLISPRPLLVIGGEKVETLHFAKTAYERAEEPKELVIIKEKTHFDLYDDASEAGPKVVAFLAKNL